MPRGLGGLVRAHPLAPRLELMAAIVVANDALATLVQQQAEAKVQEEQEVEDAAVGSLVRVLGFG